MYIYIYIYNFNRLKPRDVPNVVTYIVYIYIYMMGWVCGAYG